MNPEWIAVGQVTAPHGCAGEVRVFPLTDFPNRFDRTERVVVRRGGRISEFRIERWRPHRGMLLLKLAGVDSTEDAERLRGARLEVPVSEVEPLPPDSYYLFQIVGLEVEDETGRRLGRIREVLNTGANDVYVVRPEPGVSERDILLPAIRQVVTDIDLEAGVVRVRLLPGLIVDGEESGDDH